MMAVWVGILSVVVAFLCVGFACIEIRSNELRGEVYALLGRINAVSTFVKENRERLDRLERGEPRNKVFRPDFGQKYYYITSRGGVHDMTNYNDKIDHEHMVFGNCFRTEHEAAQIADVISHEVFRTIKAGD